MGKPEVWVSSCSTVTTSLPLVANSGTTSPARVSSFSDAVGEEQPHRAGGERLGAGEHDVAGVAAGPSTPRVAEGHVEDDLAVARQRQLARGEQPGVDLPPGPSDEVSTDLHRRNVDLPAPLSDGPSGRD